MCKREFTKLYDSVCRGILPLTCLQPLIQLDDSCTRRTELPSLWSSLVSRSRHERFSAVNGWLICGCVWTVGECLPRPFFFFPPDKNYLRMTAFKGRLCTNVKEVTSVYEPALSSGCRRLVLAAAVYSGSHVHCGISMSATSPNSC